MKHFPVVSIIAAAIVCAWAPAAAHAQTTPQATSTSTTTATTSSTTAATTTSTTVTPTREAESAYVARLQARYPTLASQSNLESLVHGLRTGSAITLTGSTTAAAGTATAATTFTPPTRPMGYGNVTRAMTLATRQLAAAGVTDPTPQQLQTALMGGSVTTPTGTTEMKGVLQLRSSGMGWGKIAHSIGVAPGMGSATAAAGTRAAAPATRTGITTAAGTPGATGATKTTGREHAVEIRGRGIVTASGTGVSAMPYRNANGSVAGTSLAANVSSGHGVVHGAGSGAGGVKAHGGRH